MTHQTTLFDRLWPRLFLDDFERIGPALWLYLYLLTHCDTQRGYVRNSFRKVAGSLGVSAVDLKAWLEQLEEEGYLQDESLDGKMIVKIHITR